MIKSFLRNSIFASFTFLLFSFDLPNGWFNAGSKPKSYEMGIESGTGQNGGNAATIRSINKKNEGFGTLMQQCKPDRYLGKRVKMTAYVKSENVLEWAGLWLRIDQSNSKQPLAFDNMSDRPIKYTTTWTKYEIILNVPINATLIAYGALLQGTGQIWFDNITFEVVNDNIETTGSINGKMYTIQNEPVNLDFEE